MSNYSHYALAMLRYQVQDSKQTLREGIDEYNDAFRGLIATRYSTPAGERFFRSHDVVHVVFGCDISLNDEVVVKICSVFGSTAGLGVLRGYRLPEAKEGYEDIRLGEIVTTAVHSLYLVPRAIVRCRRMCARWPWEAFDEWMDRPLCDIRSRFGIRVADG